jgi:hypothetical protein
MSLDLYLLPQRPALHCGVYYWLVPGWATTAAGCVPVLDPGGTLLS